MSADLVSTKHIPAERNMYSGSRNGQAGLITRGALGTHSRLIGILVTRASKSLVACEMPTQEQLKTALELGYTEEQLSRKPATEISRMIAARAAEPKKESNGEAKLTKLVDLINASEILVTKEELDIDALKLIYKKRKNLNFEAIEHDIKLLTILNSGKNTTAEYNKNEGLSKALLNGLYPEGSTIMISEARANTGVQHLENNGDREAVVIGIVKQVNNAKGTDNHTAIKVHVKPNDRDDRRSKGQEGFISPINKQPGPSNKRRLFTIIPENIVSVKD